MKVINKNWGEERILEKNSQYMVKQLIMKPGHRCSLQHHSKKRETIYVIDGILEIQIGKAIGIYKPGMHITIVPGIIHRMTTVSNTACCYLECSTPDDGTDVIRHEDDYGRV